MVGSKESTSGDNGSNLRKTRKPMVEKQRRDRMNQSISLLKSLIEDTIQQQTTPMTRIDKADILELTVYHLTQQQQQQQKVTMPTNNTSYNKGFKECARVAITFLENNGGVHKHVSKSLSRHLYQIYTSRDNQCKTQSTSGLQFHDNKHHFSKDTTHVDICRIPLNTIDQNTYSTPVTSRLSTPIRDERSNVLKDLKTPTFSPIIDPNTSLPYLSASFDSSSLEFTPNSTSASMLSESSMSTSRDASASMSKSRDSGYSMSLSHDSSISRTDDDSVSSACTDDKNKLLTGSDVVTIGDNAEETVGHVIKEKIWRPW